jgi:hypothetical protein
MKNYISINLLYSLLFRMARGLKFNTPFQANIFVLYHISSSDISLSRRPTSVMIKRTSFLVGPRIRSCW